MPEFCLAEDQRGAARTAGSSCDLGAFEVQQIAVFGDGFEDAEISR